MALQAGLSLLWLTTGCWAERLERLASARVAGISAFHEDHEVLDATNGICEDEGHTLPEAIRAELRRDLTKEEEQRSFESAGLYLAGDRAPVISEQPVALWILGPSGAGKSIAWRMEAANVPDPVTMDGDYFRSFHGGYQAARFEGLYRIGGGDPDEDGCTFREPWETVKPYRGAWRKRLWSLALEAKRNLVIVDVCTIPENCVSKMEQLKALGYTNNVVAQVARQTVVEQRGVDRQLSSGKRFLSTFRPSMMAITPIISAANGWYKVFDNTAGVTPEQMMRCEKHRECPQELVSDGQGLNLPSSSADKELKAVLEVEAEIETFVEGIEKNQAGGWHLPLCEDLQFTLSEDLRAQLDKPYTQEEIDMAAALSMLPIVSKGHAKPVALWVLGPAGVGKTTAVAASELPARLGLSKMSGGNDWDAVILDGEFYRMVHAGFKAVTQDGRTRDPPCVWGGGWVGRAKRDSKAHKRSIHEQAIKQRSNLIIPTSAAAGLYEALRKMEGLKQAGYVNHVLMVSAKSSVVDTRGFSRADWQGKAYVSTFWESVHAFTPMVAAANGRYEFIENTGVPRIVPGLTGNGGDLSQECATRMVRLNTYLEPAAEEAVCGEEAVRLQALERDILDEVWRTEKNAMITGHLPLCESMGLKVPKDLMAEMNRDITEDEYTKAEALSGTHTATKNNKKPIAVWLLGPSAVGKSTASKGALEEYGIRTVDGRADAVSIDGEIFRSVHEGFKDLVEEGRKQETPCIWKSGWKKTSARTASKVFKKRIFNDAIKAKQNLIIPSPCSSDLQGCLDRVATLKREGYVNHMVVIYARKALVDQRGTARADRDGKMYVSTVEDSIDAYARMIVVGNGRYSLVDNSGATRSYEGQQKGQLCLNRESDGAELAALELRSELRHIFEPMFDGEDKEFTPSAAD